MTLAPDFGLVEEDDFHPTCAGLGTTTPTAAGAANATVPPVRHQAAVQRPLHEDPDLAATFPYLKHAHPFLIEVVQVGKGRDERMCWGGCFVAHIQQTQGLPTQ